MIVLDKQAALLNIGHITTFSGVLAQLLRENFDRVSIDEIDSFAWRSQDVPAEIIKRSVYKVDNCLVSDNLLADILEKYANEYKKPRRIKTALVVPEKKPSLSKRAQIIDKHDSSYMDDLFAVAPLNPAEQRAYALPLDLLFVGIEPFIAYISESNYFSGNYVADLPSSITIVESRLEALILSLYLLDYQKILTLFPEKKISFNLTFNPDHEGLSSNYLEYILSKVPASIYSLTVFTSPFPDKVLLQFIDFLFSEDKLLSRLLGSLGNTADEINQSYQCLKNVKGRTAVSAISFPFQTSDIPRPPAILVGSGPSLDQYLVRLNQIPHDVPVFCAGSSIKSLLLSGIIPSYLILLERGSSLYTDLLSLLDEGYSLSAITLICSSAIDDRIPDLFCKTVFYDRNSISSSFLFDMPPESFLSHGGPESLNVALEILCRLGFCEIYAFGVDFGASTRASARASNALGESPRLLDRPIAGSDGKTIFTSDALIFARDIFEMTLRAHPSVRLMRIGVGAPIASAHVCSFDAFKQNIAISGSGKSFELSTLDVETNAVMGSAVGLLFESKLQMSQALNEFIELYLGSQLWSSVVHQAFASLLFLNMLPRYAPSSEKQARARSLFSTVIRQYVFYAGHYLYVSASAPLDVKTALGSWFVDTVHEIYSFYVDTLLQLLLAASEMPRSVQASDL